jgi:quercetin dioxygenase-like cupin family protein
MKLSAVIYAAAVLFFLSSSPVWAKEGVKITTLVKSSETIAGKKIAYPPSDKAEMSALLVEVPPHSEIGLHMHPVPLVVYVLEGTMDVEISGGEKRKYEQGTAFLEVVNTWHNGINSTDKPLKLLVVFAGEVGKSNLIGAKTK